MSTKYILPEGRSAVHALILDCIRPCITAQELTRRPELFKDREQLRSKVAALAVPLVDQIVEVLAGNAEGADEVLRKSIRLHKEVHEKRMIESTTKMMDDFLDALFDIPGRGTHKPKPNVAQAEARQERPADVERKSIADRGAEAAEAHFEKLLKSLGISVQPDGSVTDDDEPEATAEVETEETVHRFRVTKEQAALLKDPEWIAKALGLDKR
jgi:hypothetical protein